jgi:hypothetical protein
MEQERQSKNDKNKEKFSTANIWTKGLEQLQR